MIERNTMEQFEMKIRSVLHGDYYDVEVRMKDYKSTGAWFLKSELEAVKMELLEAVKEIEKIQHETTNH